MSIKAETDILDQSALLPFFVLMSPVLEAKETEKHCGHDFPRMSLLCAMRTKHTMKASRFTA